MFIPLLPLVHQSASFGVAPPGEPVRAQSYEEMEQLLQLEKSSEKQDWLYKDVILK